MRQHLTSRGLSRRTVDTYLSAICRADRWLEGHGTDLTTCTPTDVARFVDEAVPNTWSSRKLTRTALTLYWEFIERPAPPVKAIRVPPKPRFTCRAIPDYEARKLADAAYHWDEGPQGLAVLFGLYGALRRFEIAKVRWDEVDSYRGVLAITGKGDVTDRIPLHSRVVSRLEWWRDVVTDDPDSLSARPGEAYVFANRDQSSVAPATVWKWVKKVAAEAGIAKLTTHQLRHTCLATANDITHDLRGVQQLARHSDPATTVLYTRVDMDRLRGVVSSLEY